MPPRPIPPNEPIPVLPTERAGEEAARALYAQRNPWWDAAGSVSVHLPESVVRALLLARGWQAPSRAPWRRWVSPSGKGYDGSLSALAIALTAEINCQAAYDAIVRGQGE